MKTTRRSPAAALTALLSIPALACEPGPTEPAPSVSAVPAAGLMAEAWDPLPSGLGGPAGLTAPSQRVHLLGGVSGPKGRFQLAIRLDGDEAEGRGRLVIGRSAPRSVGGNQTEDVSGNKTTTVGNDETIWIGANSTRSVGSTLYVEGVATRPGAARGEGSVGTFAARIDLDRGSQHPGGVLATLGDGSVQFAGEDEIRWAFTARLAGASRPESEIEEADRVGGLAPDDVHEIEMDIIAGAVIPPSVQRDGSVFSGSFRVRSDGSARGVVKLRGPNGLLRVRVERGVVSCDDGVSGSGSITLRGSSVSGNRGGRLRGGAYMSAIGNLKAGPRLQLDISAPGLPDPVRVVAEEPTWVVLCSMRSGAGGPPDGRGLIQSIRETGERVETGAGPIHFSMNQRLFADGRAAGVAEWRSDVAEAGRTKVQFHFDRGRLFCDAGQPAIELFASARSAGGAPVAGSPVRFEILVGDEAADSDAHRNRLRQIGLAVHNLSDEPLRFATESQVFLEGDPCNGGTG